MIPEIFILQETRGSDLSPLMAGHRLADQKSVGHRQPEPGQFPEEALDPAP